MQEQILQIIEIENDSRMDGYAVVTDKQTIKLLIDNEQSCCENFGYFWSNDNPQDFIGATIQEITLTDTELNTKLLEEAPYGVDEGSVMFVSFQTDRGTLQFVAYNSHNGYYGHTSKVVSQQLMHEEIL